MELIDLVDPPTTIVLTQECQRGVIGDLSALPAMAEAVRTTGVLDNIGRIVKAGRDAGCQIVHCLAATRADRRGSSTNAPLFAAAARGPVTLLEGSEAVEVVDGISGHESDVVSTRLAGLSPVNGTDLPLVLRNLGARTIVIVGVSTNVAIPNATFDCVNLGFNVVIARDAITGFPVEYTDAMVQNTLSVVAKICTTDDLVAAWTSS